MSSLNGIEFALRHLKSELRQEGLGLAAAPGRARPDELEYQTLALKLEQVVARLRIALRELRNREQLEFMRGRGLHDVPREARYSERQSIESRLADIERVRRVAAEVTASLIDLDRQRHGPATFHDFVRGVQEIANGWAERVDAGRDLQQILQARGDGVSVRAATPQFAGADLANVVVTSVMLIAFLVQRLRKRR